MTRRRILIDSVSISVNKATRKSLKDLMYSEGLGTYEETIQKLVRRKYMRDYMGGYNHNVFENFKEKIRARDDHRCVVCNTRAYGLGGALNVHHKDWDNTNDWLENVITVCPFCHKKIHDLKIFV